MSLNFFLTERGIFLFTTFQSQNAVFLSEIRIFVGYKSQNKKKNIYHVDIVTLSSSQFYTDFTILSFVFLYSVF